MMMTLPKPTKPVISLYAQDKPMAVISVQNSAVYLFCDITSGHPNVIPLREEPRMALEIKKGYFTVHRQKGVVERLGS